MILKYFQHNSIPSGTVLYEGSDDVTSVALLVSGTITLDGKYSTTTYESGSFVGLKDIYSGFYSGDYTCHDQCTIIPLECADSDEFIDALKSHSELLFEGDTSTIILNLSKLVIHMYNELYNNISGFYDCIEASYNHYLELCTQNFLAPEDYITPHPVGAFMLENLDVFQQVKLLLSGGYPVSGPDDSNLSEIIQILSDLMISYDDLIYYMKSLVQLLISKNNDCLYGLIANLAGNTGGQSSAALPLLTKLKEAAIVLEDAMEKDHGMQLNMDMNRFKFYYNLALSGASNSDDDNSASMMEGFEDTDASALTDLLEKLTTYCSYSMEEVDAIEAHLDAYRALTNKVSADSSVRELRKNISIDFYTLYEKVFLTYAKTSAAAQYVDLFLNFGVMDKTLLDETSLNYLAGLKYQSAGIPCKAYYLKDWLMSIYNGEREPSKNEFDEEYIDYVRKKKREDNLTAEQEYELLNNTVIKVKYEIANLFKYNHRIMNSSPGTFYPMLTKESIERNLEDSLFSPTVINQGITKIMATDYSIFYRESMYENKASGIEKEIIMKEVFPDIIILPCFGTNCTMWQEISGKRMNNPGRLVVPAFFAGDIELTMLKLLGHYRWELCKSAQGLAWNDVTVPSLTSEFSDYVQFYRKNHDLSAEKKEALKSQITRCRNNTRDVFVIDYCIWIKYESAGAMRLNKVSRGILATYCPFAKNIRERIEGQPAFAEAMVKYNRVKAKKTKELTLKFGAIEKRGGTLTDELINTMEYYKDL